ncbi:LysR substrate-binding domain-containing protein [Oceanibium sediminis]|uniref:LysR substrate-binding domain-containing protein n=1 Tax=Oceanibium sediminis TaxID=2026339 RepID=UPI000DD33E63|nr:LysR substrate-binding domain-containing protein [Oceanibium sediminis]
MAELPPLNALRVFDVAGRHLNFRATAEELGVTQGAVAQQVRALEAHLGLPLFERLPKGLAFTASGRGYHARVAAAFADLRSATDILLPRPGKVTVSVTPTFAAKWLIPNLPDFAKDHPDIELRILATEKVSSFHSDGVDLAVRQGARPSGGSLDVVRLFRQQIVAVCAPALVQAETLPLSPACMARLPKLHDSYDLWPAFLRTIGVEDRSGGGLRLSPTTLTIDAALSGQGVALVSRFLVLRELQAGALVEASAQPMDAGKDFYLVRNRQVNRGPAADAAFRWFESRAEPTTG